MSNADTAPQRLLPCDITVSTPGSVGDASSRRPSTPPDYEDVASGISSANDPDEWFSPSERRTAAWLRSRGLDIRSVRRRKGHLLKTPDAVIVSLPTTIEIKSASGSANSIIQRIREGRWQARRVVVDVRGTDATRASVEAALRRALIKIPGRSG